MKERKLKVYSQTRTSSNGNFYSPTHYSEVPTIMLSGKWLESAGFSISDTINVEVMENKLIITKESR